MLPPIGVDRDRGGESGPRAGAGREIFHLVLLIVHSNGNELGYDVPLPRQPVEPYRNPSWILSNIQTIKSVKVRCIDTKWTDLSK